MVTKDSKSDSKAEPPPTVAADVCEAEFDRFIVAMDLDVDPKGMDDDDRASFVTAKRIVLLAMKGGHLVINPDGEPVYMPKDGSDQITFHEPTGASLMAMDNKREGHNVGKMYAAMADVTKESAGRFSKMRNRDLKVCQAVLGLFLG